MKQFIYVLKLDPRLYKVENWTEEDEAVVGRHFNYLKELLKEGKLIIAGKTEENDEKTFGIVVIEVESFEEAKVIMENDPGVKEGIMTSEIYPYHVALLRK